MKDQKRTICFGEFYKADMRSSMAVVQKGFFKKFKKHRQETWVPQAEKRQQTVASQGYVKIMWLGEKQARVRF